MSAETDTLNEILSIEPEFIDVRTISMDPPDAWLTINATSFSVSFQKGGDPVQALSKRGVLDALQLLAAEGVCVMGAEPVRASGEA